MLTPHFGHKTIRNDATRKDQDRERRLALLIGQLPARLQTVVRWLRQPSVRWVRIPAGLLLVLGSLFSILPILGLWMLPLGLLLIAQDVPVLQGPLVAMLGWIERKWMERRRARDAH